MHAIIQIKDLETDNEKKKTIKNKLKTKKKIKIYDKIRKPEEFYEWESETTFSIIKDVKLASIYDHFNTNNKDWIFRIHSCSNF